MQGDVNPGKLGKPQPKPLRQLAYLYAGKKSPPSASSGFVIFSFSMKVRLRRHENLTLHEHDCESDRQ